MDNRGLRIDRPSYPTPPDDASYDIWYVPDAPLGNAVTVAPRYDGEGGWYHRECVDQLRADLARLAKERVEEIDTSDAAITEAVIAGVKLTEKNIWLRETLEFYADKERYANVVTVGPEPNPHIPILVDEGERARKALAQEKGDAG